MLGKYGDAVRSFSQALEANPELGDAYFRRGICFQNSAKTKWRSPISNKRPTSPSTTPAAISGKASPTPSSATTTSVRAYGDAIAASDRFTPAYANRALAYMMIGNYKKAINDYNTPFVSTPPTPSYYYNRGVAYEMQNDRKAPPNHSPRRIEFDNKALRRRLSPHVDRLEKLGQAELATNTARKPSNSPPERQLVEVTCIFHD